MTTWCEGCGIHHDWELSNDDAVARAFQFMKRRGYEIEKCNQNWQTLFDDLVREFKEVSGK